MKLRCTCNYYYWTDHGELDLYIQPYNYTFDYGISTNGQQDQYLGELHRYTEMVYDATGINSGYESAPFQFDSSEEPNEDS